MRVKKDRKATSVPASQASEEIQHFQVKASVLLLLCLPKIRELSGVENCEDFQSLFSSLPDLSYSVFFTVVRTQKIYFVLSPLLSWLPSHVVQTLMKEYFQYTHEVTPVTLAISVELLKSLLFSQQYRHAHQNGSHDNTECLQLLVKFFFSKSVSSKTPSLIKFSGYYFLYMFECLYLLLAAYVGYEIRDPNTFSCVETWTKLWKTNNTSAENISLPYTKEALMSMLTLCQNNSREVTVTLWMEWSEQKLPQSATFCSTPSACQPGKAQAKSIQMVTCNIAFLILRLLGAHSQLEEDLAVSEYHELLQFLQQTAMDPDYDPDKDLTLEQLVEEISAKDDRREKLLGILVQREGVIANTDASRCLKEHVAILDDRMKVELLQNCIKWVKTSKPHIPESINVVVDLAADLNPDQLKPIIEDNLSAGLDDTLKTPSFKMQLTSVFNQLADENAAEPSGRHVWLCLQSGRDVVQEAVRLAVTMTGLVPVMAQTLADIPQVCLAKLPSGNSLLASTLEDWQCSELCDREEQAFSGLVKQLLSVKRLLDKDEVLQLMVKPFMMVDCNTNLGKLILPLELLKEIMELDGCVVMRPGPEVVSVMMALLHIVDATLCLEGQGASTCLTVRCLASTILFGTTSHMIINQKKFEKEITLLKQIVCQYNLHPWSITHISQLVSAEFSKGCTVDFLLQALVKTCLDPSQGDLQSPVTFASLDSAILPRMSKSKWIITLLQLLPHCSEREWTSAFFVTEHVLGYHNAVFPVLEVFQEALHLMCESLVPTPPHCQEQHSLHPPVSLHHCFTFFTSAAMIYLKEKFQGQDCRERFLNLADIFQWWCCTVPSLCCNPELPSIFLARLCGALEEIIVSGKLKINPKGNTETSNICSATSADVSVREKKLMPKDMNNTNIEISEKKEEQDEGTNICNKSSGSLDTLGMEFQKKIEEISFFMVEYVPFSNLLASVASKLKKLYDV
ncbi:uncharacterized protein LOC123510635 isoform X2 [Portunus trituberculatus]|nr:uncharacterized protein LOC123510635 isoform X2 [Portunus trituberculatus]